MEQSGTGIINACCVSLDISLIWFNMSFQLNYRQNCISVMVSVGNALLKKKTACGKLGLKLLGPVTEYCWIICAST